MWAIQAQVESHVKDSSGEWAGSRQVPTFYLNERVQGITSEEHAARIACEILDPLHVIGGDNIHVTAIQTEDMPAPGVDPKLQRLRLLVSEWEDIRGAGAPAGTANHMANLMRDAFRAWDDEQVPTSN